MEKKKYNEKVELVNDMLEMYYTRHEEKGWNENDTFDVACWNLPSFFRLRNFAI